MNYLAHAFLSGKNNDVLLGNLLGDSINKNKFHLFPSQVITGFHLHRSIDIFTDNHPLHKKAVSYFRNENLFYGAVFIDMIFDHFLANDPQYFETEKELHRFTTHIYDTINKNSTLLTPKIIKYFGHMEEGNWLLNYKSKSGIGKALEGIISRYPRLGNYDLVMACFEKNYMEMELIFKDFFPELEEHCKQFLISNTHL